MAGHDHKSLATTNKSIDESSEKKILRQTQPNMFGRRLEMVLKERD